MLRGWMLRVAEKMDECERRSIVVGGRVTMRRLRRMGLGLLVIVLAFGWGRVGAAFQKSSPVPVPGPDYSGRQSSNSLPRPPFDEQNMQALDEKRERSMNNERQRLMVKDANLLVQDAAELEARVSQDLQGAAREDAAKRAETIEKLARNVKDRMRGSR